MAAAPRSAPRSSGLATQLRAGWLQPSGWRAARKSSARRAPSRKAAIVGGAVELRQEIGRAGVARQRIVEAVGFVLVGRGRVLVAEAAVVVEVAQKIAAAGDGAVAQRRRREARARRVAAHDRQDRRAIGRFDERVGAEAKIFFRRAREGGFVEAELRGEERVDGVAFGAELEVHGRQRRVAGEHVGAQEIVGQEERLFCADVDADAVEAGHERQREQRLIAGEDGRARDDDVAFEPIAVAACTKVAPAADARRSAARSSPRRTRAMMAARSDGVRAANDGVR